MNPEAMKLAMEQMKKMSPEQMQQMQAMMQNMPPDMMQQAMSQMKDMKPDDWERAKQQMAGMSPEDMMRQTNAAQAQVAGRAQYVISASNQLKQEGNALHSRGAYGEAVEKYERAKGNVREMTGQEAKDLLRACTLNLSSCYLNLKDYNRCIEQCNEVLAGEPDSLKALYRRGQAYMGCCSWLEAAGDLERALRLAKEADASQVPPIREKLQEVKDQISALRASGKLPPASAAPPIAAPAAAPAAAAPAKEAPAPLAAASSRAAAGAGASSSGALPGMMPPGADPAMMDQAMEMMRSNPGMLKQAQEMMRNMDDSQLAAWARQMGMGEGVSPAALRDSLGGVDADTMAKIAKLQAELPPDLRGPSAARDPEAMRRIAEVMKSKPEMAAAMGEVLSSVDPAKLQEMSRAAGLPEGVTITPEMARMAAESFKRMSPEEVAEAVSTASGMPRPPVAATAPSSSSAAASGSGSGLGSGREVSAAGASTSGRPAAGPGGVGPAGPAVDPRLAAEMLAAMGPEELAAMSKMMPGGDKMQLTPEMAKMAADMMKSMSPEDLAQMQQMAAAGGMTGAFAGAGGGGGGGGGASTSGAGVAAAAAAAGIPGMTPEMAAKAAEMMKDMSPEDMAAMAQMASKMGMGPGGAPPNPADLMKNMSPEDMARMTKLASKMGMGPGMGPGTGPGGPGMAGMGMGPGGPGMGSMDSMASMMNDPKMMETAIKMMKSMDPESMVGMFMSSGMCKDRAQAELMAKQMSGLSDTQLSMMMKAAGALQNARMTGQRAMDWARRNVLLVAAVVVLLLGLLLRRFGYM